MKTVTYNGSLVNFIPILPVCSWFYKEKSEKFLFILDNSFNILYDVLKLQPFVSDIIFRDIANNLDLKNKLYDPRETDLSIKYGFEDLHMFNDDNFLIIGENLSNYYSNEMDGELDENFVLNLNLKFKYHSENISTITSLNQIFPYYNDLNESDLLITLQNLAYSKERHLPHSYITMLLSYAGVFIYLYLFDKNTYNVNSFSLYWAYYANAPILDIREVHEDRIISIYDKIYFAQ